MFIPLFKGADVKVQIIYRRMRNDNVIMINELVTVVESIVANTNYGISMQCKCRGKLWES
jgi:hypothetical protein